MDATRAGQEPAMNGRKYWIALAGLLLSVVAAWGDNRWAAGKLDARVNGTMAAVKNNGEADRLRAERLRQVEQDSREYRTDIKNVRETLNDIKTALDRLARPGGQR